MARFALLALCVTSTLTGARSMGAVEYGMTMSGRAFDAVCWYENLKAFPETHSKQYGKCGQSAQNVESQILNPSEQNAEYFKAYPDKKPEMYGQFLNSLGMPKLPKEYKAACGQYLEDPAADAGKNPEAAGAINDNNPDLDYPLKKFAYCMMDTLKERKGAEALDAVANERYKHRKHWAKTLLDRENEFRTRHGAKELKLVKALSDAAQEWADDNAKKCKMYHSKNADPRRQWHGKGTGESLSASGGPDDSAVAAYLAADGWYEEIKDYPYPGAYEGDGQDALFHKIGHFTQSVWKETEYVGYGYAYNPNCKPYTRYIAARYSPAGNLPGAFGDNVPPIQQ